MLSAREIKFVEEFFASGNAYDAALKAGFSIHTAKSTAAKWIRETREKSAKPAMWDYMQRLQKRSMDTFDVTRDQLLRGMARIAFFDPRKIMDDFGDVKPIQEWDDDSVGAIAGLELREERGYRMETIGDKLVETAQVVRVRTYIKKVKLNDRNPAQANIARMMGFNAPEKLNVESESFLDFLKKATSQELSKGEKGNT